MATRLRKRLAEVGAVYDLTPVPRSAADVLAPKAGEPSPPAPKAKAKWVTASVVDDAATVIAKVFDEGERRDPGHARAWVALVDGNNHQIDRIEKEAVARGVEVTIVVDLVHVLGYLWGSVWCFFAEGDPAAEAWVLQRALAVLGGKAREVAAGHQAAGYRRPAEQKEAHESRRLRQVPRQQGRLPRLPHCVGQGLARGERCYRRHVPIFGG